MAIQLSDKLALVGAIVMSYVTYSFATGPVFELYRPEITSSELPTAVTGWIIMSFGPILVAWMLWRLSDTFALGWILHILLIPSFYGLLLAGNQLMVSTISEPDFDDTLGAPIMPGLFCMIFLIAFYYLALILKLILRSRARSNGS